jgi:2-keto-4-pentenoate hydratase
MTNTDTIEAAALALRKARKSRRPIPPLRTLWPELSEADAYPIQRLNLAHRAARGERIVGRKIGLTSKAVQAQLGVGQPDFGALFAGDVFGDGEPVPLDRFIAPRAEAEVALLLGRDLAMEKPGWTDVARAVEAVLPAVEIVDSAIADWKIGFLDTVADNASGAATILGGPMRRLDGLDLGTVAMRMTDGDATVSSGRGSDCLGHPLNAAVWLARTLAAAGDPLRAGDLILTGALGPMVRLDGPRTLVAEIGGLGRLSAVFAGDPA